MSAGADTGRDAARLVAEALGIETDAVGPETRLGVAPQWDSLAHMRLILALEKALGRRLGPEEILSVEGPEQVAALLGSG